MSSDLIRDLVTALSTLEADDAILRSMWERLYRVGRMHNVLQLKQMERQQFAVHLLDLGVSVATVRDRLIARFDIGRSQCYRDVQAALDSRVCRAANLVHLAPSNGTPDEDNG